MDVTNRRTDSEPRETDLGADGPGFFGRRQFLAGGATALAAAWAPGGRPGWLADPGLMPADGSHLGRSCCPTRIAAPRRLPTVSLRDLVAGNETAVAIARRSPRIRAAAEALEELAGTIPDDALRAATLALLANPAPTYQALSPTAAGREAVRRELLAAGLIPAATTIAGIFPR